MCGAKYVRQHAWSQPSGAQQRTEHLARVRSVLAFVALASRAARSGRALRTARFSGGGAEARQARREAKLEHERALARNQSLREQERDALMWKLRSETPFKPQLATAGTTRPTIDGVGVGVTVGVPHAEWKAARAGTSELLLKTREGAPLPGGWARGVRSGERCEVPPLSTPPLPTPPPPNLPLPISPSQSPPSQPPTPGRERALRLSYGPLVRVGWGGG